MSLPVLHGPRVSLVPATHAVACAVLAAADPTAGADDRLTGALTALAPLSPLAPLAAAADWPHADTLDALRPLAEHGAPGDDGGWLVVLSGAGDGTGGTVVGDCGWLGGPGPDGDVEIGYGLAVSARGQGVGAEAVGLLCAWAVAQPGVRRLTADVLPGNEPSLRLLRRLGFVETSAPADRAVPPYLRLVL